MLRFRQALLLMTCLVVPSAIGASMLWAKSGVPQSVDILGIVGNIGEWEMTAKLERHGVTRELIGPMKMTHIGWCSKDGPLEKTGELRVTVARLSASIDAKIRVDGIECDYTGGLSDAYTGVMSCPGRRPAQMLLWMR